MSSAPAPEVGVPYAGLFERALRRASVFRAKETLRPAYVPPALVGRDAEAERLADALVGPLRGEPARHVVLEGPAGSGKSVLARRVGAAYEEAGRGRVADARCLVVDGEAATSRLGLLAAVAKLCIREPRQHVPPTGWGAERAYAHLRAHLELSPRALVLIVDRADAHLSQASRGLADLVRLSGELTRTSLSLVILARDPGWRRLIDPEVHQQLCPTTIALGAYSVHEVVDVLAERARIAFVAGAIGEDLLDSAAAMSLGDPARGLALLLAAGEEADRTGENRLTNKHMGLAASRLAAEAVGPRVHALNTQQKLVLLATLRASETTSAPLRTSTIHEAYVPLARAAGVRALCPRRIRSLIGDAEEVGLVRTQVHALEGKGRASVVHVAVHHDEALHALAQDPRIRHVVEQPLAQPTLPALGLALQEGALHE